jgi:hypothetical protein
MKNTKIIRKGLAAVAMAAAALALPVAAFAAAPSAQATPNQDSNYVSCASPVISHNGPAALAAFGHSLAVDINNGVAPAAEAQWVYDHTPADITGADAKNLVKCAITVWL